MLLELNLILWNLLGIDYYMDNDDRDIDNVFVDNFSDVWEFR